MERLSEWIRGCWLMSLKCDGCDHGTVIGLDAMLEMSRKNDELSWWRERFLCRKCGAKNPHLSMRATHLALEGGLDAPRGVDPAAWAKADHYERKRLIRLARD